MKKLTLAFLFAVSFLVSCQQTKDLGQQEVFIGETIAEFSIPYTPNPNENPFDVVAKVNFTRESDVKARDTEMFFANDSMHFRFADFEPGEWGFETRSKKENLNGYTGKVIVKPAKGEPNGYLVANGKKWFWNGSQKATVPQLVMVDVLKRYQSEAAQNEAITAFLKEHGFNGFHMPGITMGWFDLEKSGGRYTEIGDDPNPSPEAFDVLEQFIWNTYQAGGQFHFWWWGDESRKKTPIKWGINGKVDQRLLRYFAARLGAIPGWSTSYGFDLIEWVKPEELQQWHDHLKAKLLLPHLISGRSRKHLMTPYADDLSYESFEHHRPSYETYLSIYQNSKNKPVFSEDRFRIRNRTQFAPKDYTEELTIKGLWHSTMAGGVANIWGNLALPDGKNNARHSQPYQNKEALKTYHAFFFDKERFALDFEPIQHEEEMMWASVPSKNIVVGFVENVGSVTATSFPTGSVQKIIAVDVYKAYKEVIIFQDKNGTFQLPYASGWGLIITPEL